MRRLKRNRMLARVAILLGSLGVVGGGGSPEEPATGQSTQPATQAAAQAPKTAPATPASQASAASAQVVGYECVQVPVTYAQTYYRRECRTETVPVTR